MIESGYKYLSTTTFGFLKLFFSRRHDGYCKSQIAAISCALIKGTHPFDEIFIQSMH
jgi:hypothetical protein